MHGLMGSVEQEPATETGKNNKDITPRYKRMDGSKNHRKSGSNPINQIRSRTLQDYFGIHSTLLRQCGNAYWVGSLKLTPVPIKPKVNPVPEKSLPAALDSAKMMS